MATATQIGEMLRPITIEDVRLTGDNTDDPMTNCHALLRAVNTVMGMRREHFQAEARRVLGHEDVAREIVRLNTQMVGDIAAALQEAFDKGFRAAGGSVA